MYFSYAFYLLGAGTGAAYVSRLRLLFFWGTAPALAPGYFSADSGPKEPKTPGSGSPALL